MDSLDRTLNESQADLLHSASASSMIPTTKTFLQPVGEEEARLTIVQM